MRRAAPERGGYSVLKFKNRSKVELMVIYRELVCVLLVETSPERLSGRILLDIFVTVKLSKRAQRLEIDSLHSSRKSVSPAFCGIKHGLF